VTDRDEARWARIVARDRGADGLFWYSVASTGVYCRPSCPSRQARRENVALHDMPDAARASGVRPCLRCRPDDASADDARSAMIAAACRRIDAAEIPPPLAELAADTGLSPGHFQRVFKAAVGLSPRDYAAARRAERVRTALREGDSVTDAIYAAGYGSSGRFYDGAADELGMAPSRYRDGGRGERLRWATATCALGLVLAASSERGVAAILLGEDEDALAADLTRRFPGAAIVPGDADYQALVARVAAFVDRPSAGLDLPLDVRGTAFQRRVWDALRRVPAGTTVSYAQLAAAIGAPAAVRAVAGACAANPLAVAVPCHRVLRADGGLSGYRWGPERKRRLLAAERLSAKPPTP